MTVLRFALLAVLLAGCGLRGGEVEPADSEAGEHAGHPVHAGHELPEGHAEVVLSPERQQLIGLRTAVVEEAALAAPVRATAILAVEQDREAHVHSRIDGWIQKLYVDKVGDTVKRGQALYSIYSQQAYAAQLEYLRARKFSPELAQAARERLSQWSIPSDQIARLDKDGASQKIVIRAPISGTVLERGLLEGHYVDPGQMLFHIADLTELWVLAEVYEYEIDRIDADGIANVWLEGSDAPIALPIEYIYPTVDPTTRTVRVRLLLPNPDGRHRPHGFATVELPTRSDPVLSVPEDAVIDTGVRRVVYRALAGGRFAPVEVQIGRRAAGRTEIVAGLAAGDTVVVGAQFLIDSESRLRGRGGGAGGHAGHG